jgi:hypothetical protein
LTETVVGKAIPKRGRRKEGKSVCVLSRLRLCQLRPTLFRRAYDPPSLLLDCPPFSTSRVPPLFSLPSPRRNRVETRPTLGGTLDLVVKGLDALLNELVTGLAELEEVSALLGLLDELLEDGGDDGGGGLVLVKGGGGDCQEWIGRFIERQEGERGVGEGRGGEAMRSSGESWKRRRGKAVRGEVVNSSMEKRMVRSARSQEV